MALTRKMLKAMSIEEDKIDQIIDAHTETVDGLKADITKYKRDAESLKDVQTELDKLKKDGGDDWKDKYNAINKEYSDYKAEITAKETKAAKEKAVRSYYESKGISGKNLEIAMRGSAEEIKAVELYGDKIKDTAAIDTLIAGDFEGLVSHTETQGALTAKPPINSGGKTKITKADIYKRDDKGRYIMSTAERQKALAENPELLS